jgi:hypothetical protein
VPDRLLSAALKLILSQLEALPEARESPQSLFCRGQAVLANRLNMSRIIATSMNVSLVCTRRS